MDSGNVYHQRFSFALDFIENTLREELRHLGLSYSNQTVTLVTVSLLLAVCVVRLFKNSARLLVALVFIAFALRILIPVLDSWPRF